METILTAVGICLPVFGAMIIVMQRLTRVETKVDILMASFTPSHKGD